MRHIDWCAKIMLTTGLIVFYGYMLEVFYAYYSGNLFEIAMIENRFHGPYRWTYYALLFCNGFVSSFGIPTAAAVPAADVHRRSHSVARQST